MAGYGVPVPTRSITAGDSPAGPLPSSPAHAGPAPLAARHRKSSSVVALGSVSICRFNSCPSGDTCRSSHSSAPHRGFRLAQQTVESSYHCALRELLCSGNSQRIAFTLALRREFHRNRALYPSTSKVGTGQNVALNFAGPLHRSDNAYCVNLTGLGSSAGAHLRPERRGWMATLPRQKIARAGAPRWRPMVRVGPVAGVVPPRKPACPLK
jgi:hypothetical protein